MSKINITLLDRSYLIQCKDGDEGRVENTSIKLNQKLDELKAKMPQASEATVMAFCALIMMDELSGGDSELKNKVTAMPASINADNVLSSSDIDALNSCANNLEFLAKKLV